MSITFCPIASGSNGNSIYIATPQTRILIDAGLSGKRIEAGLQCLQVHNLDAIFLTHEHIDHMMGAGVLSRRFDIPIFATTKTWAAMEREGKIGKITPKNKRYVYYEENCIINDIVIKPFEIPHDAAEPAGYNVFLDQYKISVATDIGCVTDKIKNHIADSHVLLIESNHDVEMLKNGSYSWPLKKRILGDRGHLSNVNCGLLLADVLSGITKHVYLGHLSEENNRPLLALETVRSILFDKKWNPDKDFSLCLAERGRTSLALNLP